MRFFDLLFFAYFVYPKAKILGLKVFRKKFAFTKIFDYKVVRNESVMVLHNSFS